MENNEFEELEKEFEKRAEGLLQKITEIQKENMFFEKHTGYIPKERQDIYENYMAELDELIHKPDKIYKFKIKWKMDMFHGMIGNTLYMPTKKEIKKLSANFLRSKEDMEKEEKEFVDSLRGLAPIQRFERITDRLLDKFFKMVQMCTQCLSTSNIFVIPSLPSVLIDIELVIIHARMVSLQKVLGTIKRLRFFILPSYEACKRLIDLDSNGLVAHHRNKIDLLKSINGYILNDTQTEMAASFNPLFIANTHISKYEEIFKVLDNANEMVMIELKNGKSLDYSILNDNNPQSKSTASESMTAPERIKLNYGANNDKIVQLLYDELNGTLIENIDFNAFERHFKENEEDLKKMQWKGTQPEIIRLFTGLPRMTHYEIKDLKGIELLSDREGYNEILNHFCKVNRKGEETDFIYNTLTSKKSTETKKENTQRISIILDKIRNVVS